MQGLVLSKKPLRFQPKWNFKTILRFCEKIPKTPIEFLLDIGNLQNSKTLKKFHEVQKNQKQNSMFDED